jgi:hypothetical protein
MPRAISAISAIAYSGSRSTNPTRRDIMTNLKVAITSALILLTTTACKMAVEALPVTEANAAAAAGTYVTEFSEMHSAIPVGAGSDIEDYQ